MPPADAADAADAEAAIDALRELPDRLRADGWSMAAALTRYAQPQPELVGALWQEIRRVLWSLQAGSELLEADGAELLERARAEAARDEAPGAAGDRAALVVAVLRAALALDELGDVLVAWGVDRAGERPDAEVEAAVQEVGELLDAAGVPHEPRPGPAGGRGQRAG